MLGLLPPVLVERVSTFIAAAVVVMEPPDLRALILLLELDRQRPRPPQLIAHRIAASTALPQQTLSIER